MSDLRRIIGNLRSGPSSEGNSEASKISGSSDANTGTSKSVDTNHPSESYKELQTYLDELDALIGLDAIKREVKKLVSLAQVSLYKEQKNLKSTKMTYHLIFSGSPGTGKTTIARLIGNIYRCLGIVKKGHIVECDRSGLVAGYTGQTAIKTSDVITSALDGVLFIDEAYALSTGKDDSFGKESIDTIVKAMEDNRSRLIVIAAGYSKEMTVFLDSNSGLKSRFKNTLTFKDFSNDELLDIFKMICKSNHIKIDHSVEKKVATKIASEKASSGNNFGNGRAVRNLFEDALGHQAMRATEDNVIEKKELEVFTEEDIPE